MISGISKKDIAISMDRLDLRDGDNVIIQFDPDAGISQHDLEMINANFSHYLKSARLHGVRGPFIPKTATIWIDDEDRTEWYDLGRALLEL